MAARSRSVRLFSFMQFPASSQSRQRSHNPTPLHFLAPLLNQCSTFNHITQAHAFMISRGLDQDNLLLSNFIHVSSALGFIDYAFTVFELKQNPNIYLYNTMMRSLYQSDSARDAICLFKKIQFMGFRPDTYSFPFVLKAAAHLSMHGFGRAIHGQVHQ